MRYFAFLSFFLLPFFCYATTNVNIYQADIVLGSDMPDKQARIEGMKSVIIRATGDNSAVNNSVIKKALDQNSQYLSQIGYAQVKKQKILKMKFSENQIKALLTQAQLPFWPPQRETILVWLAEDDDIQRTIIWENVGNEDVLKLKHLAEDRGLPVVIPVGDFDDITGIDPSDVWGNFIQPISRASQRYHPDAVLVIRIHKDNIRWSLYDQVPAEMDNFSATPITGSASGEHALDSLADQLTHYYAHKNAVVVHGSSSQSVNLKVTGLSRAISFFSLENALNQLSSVASVDVSGIQGDTVLYQIHLLTSQKEFEQEMQAISMIEKDPEEGVSGDELMVEPANDDLPVTPSFSGSDDGHLTGEVTSGTEKSLHHSSELRYHWKP